MKLKFSGGVGFLALMGCGAHAAYRIFSGTGLGVVQEIAIAAVAFVVVVVGFAYWDGRNE